PRERLPEEVLRLVPRPRPLPAAVQAGAGRPRLDGGGRETAARRGPRCDSAGRAPRGRDPLWRRADPRASHLDLRRRVVTWGNPWFPQEPLLPGSDPQRAPGLPAGKAGLRPQRSRIWPALGGTLYSDRPAVAARAPR